MQYVVLDEAHMLKNMATVRYDNLARINVSTNVTLCKKFTDSTVYFILLNAWPPQVWRISERWQNSKELQTQLSKYHGTECHLQNFIPTRSLKTKNIHPIKLHRTSSAQAIHTIVSVLLTDDIQLWMYILQFGVLNNWHNQAHIQHVTCYYINNVKVLNVFYHLWPFNCWSTCHITVSIVVTL